MKISAQFMLWSSVVFALVCFGVAFDGFSHLDAVTDEATRSDSVGYALFWAFLGMVAVASALASHWIIRRENANPSD
jgi:uncharacterized membrane protein YidH (DUF202 family)